MNVIVLYKGNLYRLPIAKEPTATLRAVGMDFTIYKKHNSHLEVMVFPLTKKGEQVLAPVKDLQYVSSRYHEERSPVK